MRKLLLQIITATLLLAISQSNSLVSADEAIFREATQLYRQGEWQQASDLLSRYVNNSDPALDHSLARLYWGECLMQLGSYSAAQEKYRAILKESSNKTQYERALFRAGEAAWFMGDHREAQQLLTQYVQQYPAGSTADFANSYLTEIASSPQLMTNQLRIDKKITTVSAESSPADKLLDEAVRLERDGRYDPALAAYHELLEKYPTDSTRQQALLRVAHLHAKLSQLVSAREYYQEYLTAYPNSKLTAEVLAELAWLEVRSKNLSAADKAFTKVHEDFPQTTQAAAATYWLALRRADEKKSPAAHRYTDWLIYHHAKSKEPSLHILWDKAVCLKCQLAAAEADWQTILELVSNLGEQVKDQEFQTQAFFWQAEAKFRTGEYKDARVAFEKLEIQVAGIQASWAAMVPLRQAQLFARRQQWTEALKQLDKLEKQFPEFELDYEADYLRGRALAGRAEMSAAREAYQQVLTNPNANQSETAAMARWMIGETYFHQSNYTLAREVYLEVIEHHSKPEWQARAALQAGKCWELEDQWNKARELYSIALERWSGSKSEKQLQSRLKWANKQITQRR